MIQLQLKSNEILSRCSLFFELAPQDTESLALKSHVISLKKGETLFTQDDPVDHMYVVSSGAIKVYKYDIKRDRQLVLHIENAYRLVAEVAVFMESPRYPAWAEAVEDSTVLAIPTQAFYELVESRPVVSRTLIRSFAKRQGRLIHLLDRLVFREVSSRLADYLLKRAGREGEGFLLPANSELAAHLGTVAEPASRKLGEFYRQGLINLKDRKVWIVDEATLRQIAFD